MSDFAAVRLKEFRITDAEVINTLIDLLDDKNWQVRNSAASVLGSVGAGFPQVLPALEESFHDKEGEVAATAAYSHGKITGDFADVVPVFIGVLKNGTSFDQLSTAQYIAEIGPEAREALPTLLIALDRTDIETMAAIIEAIGALGPCAQRALDKLRYLADYYSYPRADSYEIKIVTAATEAIAKIEGSLEE
jgi:HEAT repeat protein